jgi:tRNA(Ile)-lysidine synthase TilS/MesJ
VSENKVPKGLFGGKKGEQDGENYIVRSFIICNFQQILLVIKSKIYRMGETCSADGETRSEYKIFLEKFEEKEPRAIHGFRRKENIKVELAKEDVKAWSEFTWLNIGPMMGLC